MVLWAAGSLYLVCAVIGFLSVFWRRLGWLTDHAGNVAVCGFIMAAAFPGAWLQRLGHRRGSGRLVMAGRIVLPVAAGAWGLFFVLMEIWPLYGPNARDLADIPASVIGTLCGFILGTRFEHVLVGEHAGARARRVRDPSARATARRPAAAPAEKVTQAP